MRRYRALRRSTVHAVWWDCECGAEMGTQKSQDRLRAMPYDIFDQRLRLADDTVHADSADFTYDFFLCRACGRLHMQGPGGWILFEPRTHYLDGGEDSEAPER